MVAGLRFAVTFGVSLGYQAAGCAQPLADYWR